MLYCSEPYRPSFFKTCGLAYFDMIPLTIESISKRSFGNIPIWLEIRKAGVSLPYLGVIVQTGLPLDKHVVYNSPILATYWSMNDPETHRRRNPPDLY